MNRRVTKWDPDDHPELLRDSQTGCMTITESIDAVSVVRRNLLRGCHLLLVVGLGLTAWPRLLTAAPDRPLMDGVVDAMLCGMQLLAILGLIAPLRMLPVILFDIVWKVLWVVAVAIPAWLGGAVTPGISETLVACAWAIPFVIVVPWRWAYTTLIRGVEPWKPTTRKQLDVAA